MCVLDVNRSCYRDLSNYTLERTLHWFTYFGHARDVSTAFGLLGCVGSFLIIASFLFWPQLRRTTSRRILVWISVCDFIACLINVASSRSYPGIYDDAGCVAEAFLWIVSTLGFVLWSTALSIHLYFSLVHRNAIETKHLMIIFHVLCWGIPLIVATAALFSGALGNSSMMTTIGWCWVSMEAARPLSWRCMETRFFWMMLTLKGWEIVSYFAIPVLYLVILRQIHKETSGEVRQVISRPLSHAIRSVNVQLAIVPVCFVFLRIWGTIRVLIDIMLSSCLISFSLHLEQFFNYTQAIGDNSQGFVNFILFICLTKSIRQGVYHRLQWLMGYVCFWRHPSRSQRHSDGDNRECVNETDHSISLIAQTPAQRPREKTQGKAGEKQPLLLREDDRRHGYGT